jgi:hypothetical protein
MSGITTTQILAASPDVAGGVYRAPLGTALPTDTTTALNVAFIPLGWVDDDGITVDIARPNTPQYGWGGGLVASLQTSFNNTFSFKLLQPLDPDVLKTVYSDSNVTVTPPTSTVGTLTTTTVNPKLPVNSTWVFSGYYQQATVRWAVPIARVTTQRATRWTHKALQVYDVTVQAFPDTSGNFSYLITDDGIHT